MPYAFVENGKNKYREWTIMWEILNLKQISKINFFFFPEKNYKISIKNQSKLRIFVENYEFFFKNY